MDAGISESDDISAHMHRVQLAGRELRELGTVWRTIEAAAAISCPAEVAGILPTLIATRERFEGLQARLIGQMADENRQALGDELLALAQCTIDILVRNLFERTADVGFLATDEVVQAFCAADDDTRAQDLAALRARLAEYQAKYTVYDDIVLLAPDGRVLARLDDRQALACCDEPLVARAAAAPAFVEHYGATALAADGQPALLYAHRIANPRGGTAGVLVLRFRFADEMRQIFGAMQDSRQELAIVLLGDDQRVLASNDEAHVPIGARLRPVAAGGVQLTTFAGREYLAVCCASPGYQGYAGPGWRAQAMVSLLTAFRHRSAAGASANLLPHEHGALLQITTDADAINRELRRVVWNGQLMADDAAAQAGEGGDGSSHGGGNGLRLKAVLDQINQASVRTRRRVAEAIDELARTALLRAEHQSRELARLAADILDRNLYERANDCRWWALSPAVQQALAAPAGPAATQALQAVLDRINGLYTVYSRLVVFDAAGRIRGVSRAGQAPPVTGLGDPDAGPGPAVPADWLAAVQALRDTQQYAVSPFADTPLHDAGPTYTYLAAIRDPATGRGLGGIAIVFNAAREFTAMLREVLGERPGFAAFVDAEQRVLASTHPGHAVGQRLALPAEGLAELDGVHHACAVVRTAGYREFKRSDGHDDGVRAVLALRLGTVERRRLAYSDQALSLAPLALRGPGPGHPRALDQATGPRAMAVFQVGAGRYAVPAAALLQAVSQQGLVPTPDRRGHLLGLLRLDGPAPQPLIRVMCARRLFGLQHPARGTDGVVLVLRDPRQPARAALGLRVDDVLAVLDVEARQLHPPPQGAQAFAPWMAGLVEARAQGAAGTEQVLLQTLDPLALIAHLAPGLTAGVGDALTAA